MSRYVSENLPDYRYFRHFLPGTAEIDGILIGPAGAFHVEVKDWKGRILGSSYGPWQITYGDGHQEERGNPIAQVRNQSAELGRYFRNEIPGLEARMRALLVFTHPEATLAFQEDKGSHQEVHICSLDKLKDTLAALPQDGIDERLLSHLESLYFPVPSVGQFPVLTQIPSLRAELEFPTFFRIRPEDNPPLSFLEAGLDEKAQEYCEKQVREEPTNPWVHWNLACVLSARDEPSRAISVLEAGKKCAETDSQLSFVKAQLRLSRPWPRRAIRFARELIEQGEQTAETHLTMVELLGKLGSVPAAFKWAEHVSKQFGYQVPGLKERLAQVGGRERWVLKWAALLPSMVLGSLGTGIFYWRMTRMHVFGPTKPPSVAIVIGVWIVGMVVLAVMLRLLLEYNRACKRAVLRLVGQLFLPDAAMPPAGHPQGGMEKLA